MNGIDRVGKFHSEFFFVWLQTKTAGGTTSLPHHKWSEQASVNQTILGNLWSTVVETVQHVDRRVDNYTRSIGPAGLRTSLGVHPDDGL